METDIYFVMGPGLLAAAVLMALFAGFVKGTVGFAMPMIMISALGSFLPPEAALAGLILPTLVSNVWQALRQGISLALASARLHWRYLGMLLFFIALSAQTVTILPAWALFLILGVPVTGFALIQLVGWKPKIETEKRLPAELGIGAFAGAIGGVSGVWGPPTVLYLTAMDTPKVEHIRVQGVVYAVGAIMLTLAHLKSGVLTAQSIPLSLILLVPALLGMGLGFAVQDRLDQALFRKLTLIVLVVAGLNLVRRGLLG